MCGIAGVLGLGRDLSPADAMAAQRMTAALRHRGPDSHGVESARRGVLGNSRLRLLDLSAAADLPMADRDAGLTLAYNGEVTNFRELTKRHGLEPLRTRSDAEVLLKLWRKLGPAALAELSGQFAFCLHDARAGKAWLVRDFFGICPLFYRVANGRLQFASELKAFFELDDFTPKLDGEAFYHYFSLAYIPGARTPYADVRELPSGHLVEIDLDTGAVREREYFRPRYDPTPIPEAEAAERLHELLLDSVRRNLASDAPLGMTLSGGIDTSTLLALVKELGLSKEMHTFSIRMGESSFDEGGYQRQMAEFAGTRHHELTVGPQQVLDALVPHMAYLDEPVGDGSAIPSFLLAQEAKRHVSVLLSGEGGDEVFNAYETHGALVLRGLYRKWVPAPARALARAAAALLPVSHKKLSLDFLLKRFTAGAEMGVPESHLYWRHVLPEAEKRRLLPGLSDVPPTETLFRGLYDAAGSADDLNRISLIDLKFFFLGDLMVKNDRMFMAHSVEGRFPFMDRAVFDFASRLPVDMRVRGLGFKRRWIQKRAMAGRMPESILRRKNFGLEMPHSIWFFGAFRETAERYFARDNVARTGLLDPDTVQALWQEHLAGRRDNGRALWCVLMFQVWSDLFLHRSPRSRREAALIL